MAASPLGAADVVEQPPATVTTISLEGALVPLAFRARTRTKYVPGATPVAVSAGIDDPVSALARLLSPVAEPASRTYEVGGSPPAGAVHVKTTVVPETAVARAVGATGATIGGQTFAVTQQVCSVVVSTPPLFLVEGGTVAVTVTTSSGCTWTAQVDASFITITSAASGTGSGTIGLSVQSNSGLDRGGRLTVGQVLQTTTATVVQRGTAGSTSCGWSTSRPSATFDGNGGTMELRAGANGADCAWIATSTVPWVAVYATSATAQPYGLGGGGHFGFSVAPNPTDTQRSGSIVAAGGTFQITQLPCPYTVSPTTANVLAAGGTGVITVTTACAPPWTAVSNASFMTITAGSNGTGNGSVTVSIAANTGAARTGTLTVAGQTVTMTQSAP